MARRSPPVLVGFFSILFAYLYGPEVYRQLSIFGFFREPFSTVLTSEADLVVIQGTKHCEDLHYHEPSNNLFTACEDSDKTRWAWFPPLTTYEDATVLADNHGGIFVIDAKTQKAQKLKLQDFTGPLVTHGIDVISDPKNAEAVYVFAVNHLPNPARYGEYPYGPEKPGTEDIPKPASRIEIFRHVIGSGTAKHMRSVQHPLIRTPNDLLARGPNEFFVTNDHFYTDGNMRKVEDVVPSATWTDTVHVQLDHLEKTEPTAGVQATVAIKGMWNNNGLSHGPAADDVIISSAVGGTLYLGKASLGEDHEIKISQTLQFDTVTDNPSYFRDPYANATFDGSGILTGGVGEAADVAKNRRDPKAKDDAIVWYVKPRRSETFPGQHWDRKIIFQDDGSRLRSASAAVFVPIDPKLEEGQRRAWLYVTGFLSENIVAVKVDLPDF
jgi:hypothetical protein